MSAPDPPDRSKHAHRGPRGLAVIGFLLGAVSSACCWAAIGLAALGVGAGGIAAIGSIRPVAIVVMFLLLGGALWSSWRKSGRIDGVVVGLGLMALALAFGLHGSH